jgi:hypothetical protein
MGVKVEPHERIVFHLIKTDILPLVVVIGQVDVPILEDAVGGQEICGLVSGEGDVLGSQHPSARVIEEEGGDEEKDEPGPARGGFEARADRSEERRPRQPAALPPPGPLQIQDRGEDESGQQEKPGLKILSGEVRAEEERTDEEEDEREKDEKAPGLGLEKELPDGE